MAGLTLPAANRSWSVATSSGSNGFQQEQQAHAPAAGERDQRPEDERADDRQRRTAEGHVDAPWPERAPVAQDRVVGIGVEDPVPALADRGVVHGRVVEHVIGAEGPHEVELSRAADAGHLRTAALGDLDRERPDVARRADDQHLVAGPDGPASRCAGPAARGSPRAGRSPPPRTSSRPRSAGARARRRTRTLRTTPGRARTGRANTSSPGRRRVAPGPTCSTTPATSAPRRGSRGRRRPRNSRVNPGFGYSTSRSARLTDAARTRTRTWSSIGMGRSMSRSSTTSGEPYRSRRAASIRQA